MLQGFNAQVDQAVAFAGWVLLVVMQVAVIKAHRGGGFSINNVGAQSASGVVLTETLPANTIFQGPVGGQGWFHVGTSNLYTYNIGALANGQGQVVNFVVQVVPTMTCAVTQTVNIVQVGSVGTYTVPADNTSIEQTPLACNPANQAQLSKDDGVVCAIPGQLIDYAITTSNPTSSPLTNLVLTEFLPANTTFQGPANTWSLAGGSSYTHSIGTLTRSSFQPSEPAIMSADCCRPT